MPPTVTAMQAGTNVRIGKGGDSQPSNNAWLAGIALAMIDRDVGNRNKRLFFGIGILATESQVQSCAGY